MFVCGGNIYFDRSNNYLKYSDLNFGVVFIILQDVAVPLQNKLLVIEKP
jgi:hypothetical protein